MSSRIMRVQLQCAFKLFLCALPIKLVPRLDGSHGAMSLSQRIVEFQCASGCGSRLFHIFARRDGVELREAKKRLSVARTIQGKGKSGSNVSRRWKANDCFATSFLFAFVQLVR